MSVIAWAQHLWAAHHTQLGLVGVGALVGMLLYARITKGRRPVKPALIWFGSNLALAFNAEGMWHVATVTMRLPHGFVVLVFAVFEITLMIAQMVAADRYKATTVRHPAGHEKAGQVSKPGHPGKMLYIAWTIALLSGVIVATAAPTVPERLLRLGLPIIVMLMWWGTLTAEGQEVRRSKFAYSPRRLAERRGWLVPDEDPDFQRMARERRLRSLVAHGYRLRAGTRLEWLWEWRLIRIARSADEDTLRSAEDQVVRLAGIKARFRGTAGEASDEVVDDLSESRSGHLSEDITQHLNQLLTEDRIEHLTRLLSEDLTSTSPDTSSSTSPDTSSSTSPRSSAGTSSNTSVGTAPGTAPDTSVGTSLRPSPKPNLTAQKIAKLRRRWPAATQTEIAAKAEMSTATVQRYWSITAPAPAVEQAKANGHQVPELARDVTTP